MQRLSAARWPIGIFFAVLLVGWAGTTALRGKDMLSAIFAPFLDRDAYRAEEGELRFWLAALRRMEEEQQQQPGGAPMASLRLEQAAVLQRLREAAGRMPPERLPAEIRPLLEPVAEPAPQPVVVAAPSAGSPASAVADLRVGLGTPAAVVDFSSLAVSPPSLLPVFVERRHAPRRAKAAAPAAERDEKRPPKDRDENRPPAR